MMRTGHITFKTAYPKCCVLAWCIPYI